MADLPSLRELIPEVDGELFEYKRGLFLQPHDLNFCAPNHGLVRRYGRVFEIQEYVDSMAAYAVRPFSCELGYDELERLANGN